MSSTKDDNSQKANPTRQSTDTTQTTQPSITYPDKQTQQYRRKTDGELFELYSAIVRRLRAPDGCPWDRKQTLTSLRRHLIEETFEVTAAIDRLEERPPVNTDSSPGSSSTDPDPAAEVREELGDALLVILLLATTLEERSLTTVADILNENAEKLVRRHPHVFGDMEVQSSQEVVRNWNKIKQEVEGKSDGFEKVGSDLPPLLRAHKLQKRAAKHGFDWPDVVPALNKIHEEALEIQAEINSDKTVLEEEIGDLLFAVVNVSRKLHVDPAVALSRTNAKFIRRLQFIQRELSRNGKTLDESTLEEMDALWEKAKLSPN